jgi:hypothetical protein
MENLNPKVFKVDNNGNKIDLDKLYMTPEELGDNMEDIEANHYPDFPITECWDDDYNQNNLLTPDGIE